MKKSKNGRGELSISLILTETYLEDNENRHHSPKKTLSNVMRLAQNTNSYLNVYDVYQRGRV